MPPETMASSRIFREHKLQPQLEAKTNAKKHRHVACKQARTGPLHYNLDSDGSYARTPALFGAQLHDKASG